MDSNKTYFSDFLPAAAKVKLPHIRSCLDQMKNHRLFSMVNSLEDLQTFMEWHVFAVWDFMSLVKRLQIEFTSIQVPWLPPFNNRAARLINEIVLGEESDITINGDYSSHFELYLSAMNEVGASTKNILEFIDLLRSGISAKNALQMINAPAQIATFVQSTLNTAYSEKTCEVLGSFFYGREDPIPLMFESILNTWNLDKKQVPTFVFYLERHIDIDSSTHGPAAQIIILETLGNNENSWLLMLNAAMVAINQRIMLWDALVDTLQNKRLLA